MLVILCPGQGSQKPGFMNSWLELPEYRTTLESMSESISLDLITHGTLSDEDTIRDTAIAQPLIVAASIATASLLNLASVSGVAGHSVGEVAAAQIAGIINQDQAMQLVNLRAQAMAKAAASIEKAGMAAILGGDVETVLERLNVLGLTPANFNGAGQIVAAGSAEAIQQLVAEGPEGSKIIPLSVAGAFHTPYMQPAVTELGEFVSTLGVRDPSKTLWSNQAGQQVSSGTEFVSLLVGQVANSVRWDLCMETMAKCGVTGIIEVPPAGTLAGLVKRAQGEIQTFALKGPEDLDAAKAFIAEHGGN